MDTQSGTQMGPALQEAGYRLTRPRLAVVEVLEANAEGLTAEEIHHLAKAAYPPLGLVTVYRTLDVLDELGLVRRVHSEARCQRYASARPEKHYLVCESCHRLVEFPCDGLEGLIDTIKEGSGYRITGHLLELRGVCPECQRTAG